MGKAVPVWAEWVPAGFNTPGTVALFKSLSTSSLVPHLQEPSRAQGLHERTGRKSMPLQVGTV